MAVYDYIWTEEEPGVTRAGSDPPGATPAGEGGGGGERSTHVSIYTLHLSGLRQRYRHFLRQPDGAIVEVGIFAVIFAVSLLISLYLSLSLSDYHCTSTPLYYCSFYSFYACFRCSLSLPTSHLFPLQLYLLLLCLFLLVLLFL